MKCRFVVNSHWFNGRRGYSLVSANKEETRITYPKLSEHQYLIKYGHLHADLDPLGLTKASPPSFNNSLNAFYCDKIGYEFDNIDEKEQKWFIDQIEDSKRIITKEMRSLWLKLILKSESFDHFMTKRFSQVKRYGLEGGESMMIALNSIFENIQKHDNVVIAMPHRGRLNVMTGLLNYPSEAIFHKLAGNSEMIPSNKHGTGDVLSHLSHVGTTVYGNIAILLPNSSHLESINPLALGVGFALKKLYNKSILPLMIHGDAAFTGQGITLETLQFANLEDFNVDGTVHVILNNQLGFTTPAHLGRSTKYSSDPAKMINAPIIHVNGSDPEAVANASSIAINYRNEFKKDVFLDLICYRFNGHNELDEPFFTQPLMYKIIKNNPTIGIKYAQKLNMTSQAKEISDHYFSEYDKALKESTLSFTPLGFNLYQSQSKVDNQMTREINQEKSANSTNETIKSSSFPSQSSSPFNNVQYLKNLAIKSIQYPKEFKIHPRLQKHHIESRIQMTLSESIDWPTAETLAIGSLLDEGYDIRFCGQDVGRGTFSQRHLQLFDQESGAIHIPLQSPHLQIVNSNLSEAAVLSFEYGHSIVNPNHTLTIWEAQFGDFFNGAQVAIDAYISSGEDKWGLKSNLIMLLPHGYDGAGPEHSSCRLERFLQLTNAPLFRNKGNRNKNGNSNDNNNMKNLVDSHSHVPNIRVCNPTTSSNYFHLIKRQVKNDGESLKPLIVASAKTLLRLPAANSPWTELIEKKEGNENESGIKRNFINSSFKPIISDPIDSNTKTICFLSGKGYYDVRNEAMKRGINSISFVRLEELSPLPYKEIIQHLSLASDKNGQLNHFWYQEEPENMGPLSHVLPRLEQIVKIDRIVCRAPSASPATGISKQHKQEMAILYENLFS